MNARKLGKSGIEVSVVGLGCNSLGGRIDIEPSRELVHTAQVKSNVNSARCMLEPEAIASL